MPRKPSLRVPGKSPVGSILGGRLILDMGSAHLERALERKLLGALSGATPETPTKHTDKTRAKRANRRKA